VLLSLLTSHALAAQPKSRPPDKERGEDVYERACWYCHGEEALGDGPAAAAMTVAVPALAGVDKAQKDAMVEIILNGRGDMPAFREEIDIHDARRVMTWLASLDPDPPKEEEDEEEAGNAADTEDDTVIEGAEPAQPPKPQQRPLAPPDKTKAPATPKGD